MGAFVANEFIRMTSRSPFFKLKLWNVAAVVVLPTFMARTVYNTQINERIENMWRTHKNRVDKGLGPTWKGDGNHESMQQDHSLRIPACTFNVAELWDGRTSDVHFDNPFLRWHRSFEEYDSFLGDIDDIPIMETDEYERAKKFKPLDKHVVGDTPIIPRKDDDEEPVFYDIQGEGCYTHPPNPNTPHVDHGQDEEYIWNLPKTIYNQDVIKNNWIPG